MCQNNDINDTNGDAVCTVHVCVPVCFRWAIRSVSDLKAGPGSLSGDCSSSEEDAGGPQTAHVKR